MPLHSPTPWGCSCGYRCSRVGKHPRGIYGLKHATTDPERIEQWWFGQPGANVGLRCDGLVVLDVDGPHGRRSLERLEWDLGELPASRLQVSGRGEHRFYSTPEVDSIGNSTAPLGSPPGLDLRAGSRGYVVSAPSRHESGVRYQWLDPGRPIEPLPLAWLERLLLPRPVELAVEAVAACESSAYGRAALRKEMAALGVVGPGARNNALNRAVYCLAGWVSGGELDWYELHDTARNAGLGLGLSLDEVERTISSAMNAGYARPRRKNTTNG